MTVETLWVEPIALTEPPRAAALAGLPEGDPERPTPETLAERHEVPVETVYEMVDQVLQATLPLRHSALYQKWCIDQGVEP